jgi:4-aminobutyrate aminotransferase-like enzyme
MVVTAAVFNVLERDSLVKSAADMGEKIIQRLRLLIDSTDTVVDVRGKGMFIGIEINCPAKDIVNDCLSRGLIINAAQHNILRLAPPLTIEPMLIDEGLTILEQVISGA